MNTDFWFSPQRHGEFLIGLDFLRFMFGEWDERFPIELGMTQGRVGMMYTEETGDD
jgi:hypothetical protein